MRNSHGRGLLYKLIEPHTAASLNMRQRQTTRTLAGLTFALLVLGALGTLVYYVFTGSLVPEALAGEVVFLAAYALTRSRRPTWSAGLLVAGLSFGVFLGLSRLERPASALVWVLFPILVSATLLGTWTALAFTLLNLTGLIAHVALSPYVSMEEANPSIIVAAFASVFALGASYVRRRDLQTLERQAGELTASKERYRSLFDDIPVGLYQTTPSGQVLEVNRACVQLLGSPNRDALLMTSAVDVYADPKRRARLRTLMEREGEVHNFESQFRRLDGQLIWVRENAKAVRDESGRIVSYRGSIEDITDSKLAEQRLATLASVVHQSTDTVLLTDLDCRIVYANPAFERTSGYSLEEALGRNPRILKSGQHDGAFYRKLWNTILAGKTWQDTFTNKRKDGTLYYEEATIFPVKDNSAETINYAAVKRDITESVQARERLERRNLELATLNALAQALSSTLGLKDLLDEALSRTVLTLGFSGGSISLADESTGKLALAAYEGLPLPLIEHIEAAGLDGTLGDWVYRTGSSFCLEDLTRGAPVDVQGMLGAGLVSYAGTPIVHQDRALGSLCLFDRVLHPVPQTESMLLTAIGQQIGVAVENARLFEQVEAARVALQKRAQELAQANDRLKELDRLKSEFVANMSHELRTPLNAVLGFAQLMQRSPTFPDEHRENLDIISESGEHLLDLINDVLDMSRIEAGGITLDPTDFDLYHVLESVRVMVGVRAEKKGLALAFERAPGVPQYVRTDERKLRQVLINLLSNAVKFTDEGGVTLRVSRCDPRSADPWGADPAYEPFARTRLHFEVEDSGVGIDPDELKGLFEAFTQTASGKKSQEGTGLGLPISRKFVQMMGGDVEVTSQVGQGSTFSFDIDIEPLAGVEGAPEEHARRVIGLESGQPAYRILVVDDRPENRILVRQLLQSVGFQVKEAANGSEALDLHASWRPHLVFMDMRMPVMDGYEATQRIKSSARGQDTVVISLTASALEEERAVILAAGCDDYVRKPFRDADLFAKLAQHLGVRYIYERESPSGKPDAQAAPPEALTVDALSGLPAEWLDALHSAASRARSDLVLDLLEDLDQEQAWLAGGLSRLVDEFRFDEIVALAEGCKGAKR